VGKELSIEQLNITEMEAKMAVICHSYHHTKGKPEFVALMASQTSFPQGEIELAWELMDYMEWDSTNSVPPGKPYNVQ
jgi:hypothetical protein